MSKTRRLVLFVAVVAAGASAATARVLLSGPSGPRPRPNVAADTIIRPPVNGALNVRVLRYNGHRYFYKVFLPHDYTPARQWPVIFALHGGRTRGADNVIQIREGLGNVVQERAATFPAVVIFPQVPDRTRGTDFIPADLAMLDQEMQAINGDPNRVYVTGSSFGGFTAYQLAYLHPERFAALVPVAAVIDLRLLSGWSDVPNDSMVVAVAKRIHAIPVWTFVGEKDEEIGSAAVRATVKTLEANGVTVRVTEFKDAPHSVFTRAYSTPGLFEWLLAQRRQPQSAPALPAPRRTP